MFHQRIAASLRKHVPANPSSSFPFPETPSTSPRLVLLPAPSGYLPAPPPDRRPLLEEFIRVSSHRVAAFLAEAAVLVLVLGILDRFLASNRLELHWVGGAFLISTVLLAASVALELSARLWLARS